MFFANRGKMLRFRRGNVGIWGMREVEMWPYGACRKWKCGHTGRCGSGKAATETRSRSDQDVAVLSSKKPR